MIGTGRRRCGCGVALLLLVAGLGLFCQSCYAERRLVRRDSKGHSWSYEGKTGQDHWPEMFKMCGGSRQSPINIDSGEVDFNDDLLPFEFDSDYDDDVEDSTLKNNGHTVVVTPSPNDEARTIKEGGMDDSFEFVQLHFHWGSDSKRGSEHTIDGDRYPLELHLVHRNTKYRTMEAASKKEDGIAVLAVLFKVDSEDNEDLDPIIDKLDEVKNKGDEVEVENFDLLSLLPDDRMPYYRYKGSLTTPPCSEAVIWTVFAHFEPISEKQLQQFRILNENEKGEPEEDLDDNYRKVQPLNNRVVEISPDEQPSSSPSFAASSVTFLAALLAYKCLGFLLQPQGAN